MGLAEREQIYNTRGLNKMATIATDASLGVARHKRRVHFASLVERRGTGQCSSWHDFYDLMADRPLLAALDQYPDALLISGCDWSATTAVTRLFKRVASFVDSSWGHDDELDGALLLAGVRSRSTIGRHCFQTSYVGDRYHEYLAHRRYRLIWVIREPRSAVRSLLCSRDKTLPRRAALGLAAKCRGGQGQSRLEKACATYLASIRQTLELKRQLGDRIAVVDYDELCAARAVLLPALCKFAAVGCDQQLLRHFHGKSVRKGGLADWEALIVDELAGPAYGHARRAMTLGRDVEPPTADNALNRGR